jgi:hypothetical protein
MLSPKWDIEYSDQFREARDRYSEQLDKNVLISSLSRRGRGNNAERALERKSIFEDFLQRLSHFGAKQRDPNTLPPAIDENGDEIHGFYCFEHESWLAYLYRLDSKDKKLARALVLFYESDRPQELRNLLETAHRLLES